MSKKIEITERQMCQFNLMRAMLQRISKDYMTPQQMQRTHERGRGMGPSYKEELEMAYENIRFDAARAVKGVSAIKPPLTPSNQIQQSND
jgi:hypothetical protein